MDLNDIHPTAFTCAEVRGFDRRAIDEYEIPGIILMENAGRVLTETLTAALVGSHSHARILILAGPGNNGGDGFVMARHLQRLMFPVSVLAIGKPFSWHGDAAVNLSILEHLTDESLQIHYFDNECLELSLQKLRDLLSQSDIVVDAILGTGARGAPRHPIDEIIKEVNSARKTVFAVDIPSGLGGDTGEAPAEAVRAEVTCTLAAFKKGFVRPSAAEYTGKVCLGDIGVSIKKLSGK